MVRSRDVYVSVKEGKPADNERTRIPLVAERDSRYGERHYFTVKRGYTYDIVIKSVSSFPVAFAIAIDGRSVTGSLYVGESDFSVLLRPGENLHLAEFDWGSCAEIGVVGISCQAGRLSEDPGAGVQLHDVTGRAMAFEPMGESWAIVLGYGSAVTLKAAGIGVPPDQPPAFA